jgi:DNA-directed RNA polymerase subunit L
MEINILKSSKDEIEIEVESLTIAEILRVYLNKDSAVDFAAWKREHPTKKPVLRVKTRAGTSSSTHSSGSQMKGKTAKKAVNDAVAAIEKDLDKILDDFKKMK